MNPVRGVRARPPAIASILLAVQIAGCARWAPVTQPIPEAVEKHPRAEARVTLQDGTRWELSHLRIVGDSLAGYHVIVSSASGVPEPWDRGDTVAVALADISRMEIQKPAASRPALAAGALLLAVIAVVAISQAVNNSDMGF